MLALDQSLPGHGYRFCPCESNTIYIYIVLQQHDAQMIQLWFNEVLALHHWERCSYRSTWLHSSSLWLQLIAWLWLKSQWYYWPEAFNLFWNRWSFTASLQFSSGELVVSRPPFLVWHFRDIYLFILSIKRCFVVNDDSLFPVFWCTLQFCWYNSQCNPYKWISCHISWLH